MEVEDITAFVVTAASYAAKIVRDIHLSRYAEICSLLCRTPEQADVFDNATTQGTTTMTSILVILSQSCAVTNMAMAAPRICSFARDQDLPDLPFHSRFDKSNLLSPVRRPTFDMFHQLAPFLAIPPSLMYLPTGVTAVQDTGTVQKVVRDLTNAPGPRTIALNYIIQRVVREKSRTSDVAKSSHPLVTLATSQCVRSLGETTHRSDNEERSGLGEASSGR